MKLRIILSRLLAIPTILFLLFFAIFSAEIFLLPGFQEERMGFVIFSFSYLLLAQAFYFGSYYAHPPLYQGMLRFLSHIFHSRRAILAWAVFYGAVILYGCYTIYFIPHRAANQSPNKKLGGFAPVPLNHTI